MPSLGHVKNVAIVGGTGRLGNYFVEELVKAGKHAITVLTRGVGKGIFPDTVKLVGHLDYSDEEALVAALQGQEFLVIVLGALALPETHTQIVKAAAKAGVPYIMPTAYGADITNLNLVKDDLYHQGVVAKAKEIESLGIHHIIMACGFWYEWSVALGENYFGIDIKAKRATFFDEGTTLISVSTMRQCGRALVALLSLPVSGTTPSLGDWNNKPLRFTSFRINQRAILDSIHRVQGTTDADWHIEYEPSEKRVTDGFVAMQKGDMSGFAKAMYSRAFYPSADGDYECLRLRKDCRVSDSARRRNAQRAEDSNSRIAQLESKIESLTNAIQSVVGPSSSGSSPSLARLIHDEQNTSLPPPEAISGGTLANPNNTTSSMVEMPMPLSDTLQAMAVPPSLSDPSAGQAEECLAFFQSRMLPYFPLMVLAQDLTAWQLRRERPIQFQAILTVTTFSTENRLILAENFKRIVSESALIDVQSNIDLLLGLLIYITWSTDAFLGRADVISRLMMLAVSIVYDLRLFKPTQLDVQLMMTMTQGRLYENSAGITEGSVHNFMEKQRALLACFVLSSNVSSHLGRQDALRWTPQLEEALRLVETASSHPTDEAFSIHVRLHVLKQRASYIREQHEADSARTATESVAMSYPSLLYLKTLRGQLHELKALIRPDLQEIGE
ncbi:hypothetical protein G7046_g202 [Stylonectria norvegica]|nr:hypothetical protein G7046_g202 [Stylonectria norvegica]